MCVCGGAAGGASQPGSIICLWTCFSSCFQFISWVPLVVVYDLEMWDETSPFLISWFWLVFFSQWQRSKLEQRLVPRVRHCYNRSWCFWERIVEVFGSLGWKSHWVLTALGSSVGALTMIRVLKATQIIEAWLVKFLKEVWGSLKDFMYDIFEIRIFRSFTVCDLLG